MAGREKHSSLVKSFIVETVVSLCKVVIVNGSCMLRWRFVEYRNS